MASFWKGWRVSALKLLESRVWFVSQTVLLPHFITKVVFKPRILGSYVLTVTAWALLFSLLRIFYALILYPRYFTPFRHLPTPEVRDRPRNMIENQPLIRCSPRVETKFAMGQHGA